MLATTGKTSLSFAIAGFFDLDVFCVSLAEPSITEEDLVSLFDELPEQCLVLLEDVDSAGLVVRDIQPHSTSALQRPPGGNPYEMTSRPHGTGITLSGLLNVIDGIASQEGRVLIMTTNHVNSLDAALLRPGRVDLRIHFDLASKKQAEDLFLQTFAERSHEELDSAKNTEQKDDLEEMARTFSAGIPERMLSPAGIQGYLMNWKKKPAEAVANIKEWVAESTKKDDKPPTKLVNGDHDPSRK
jgi:chaperone BCS1